MKKTLPEASLESMTANRRRRGFAMLRRIFLRQTTAALRGEVIDWIPILAGDGDMDARDWPVMRKAGTRCEI